MNLFPTEAYLTRINPEKNMQCFYALTIEPDLFGGACLIRRWGRVGCNGGAQRIEHFAYEGKAIDALAEWMTAKTRRGYVIQD